jgi:hypothetical protein
VVLRKSREKRVGAREERGAHKDLGSSFVGLRTLYKLKLRRVEDEGTERVLKIKKAAR